MPQTLLFSVYFITIDANTPTPQKKEVITLLPTPMSTLLTQS
jgi:hypothetical protein